MSDTLGAQGGLYPHHPHRHNSGDSAHSHESHSSHGHSYGHRSDGHGAGLRSKPPSRSNTIDNQNALHGHRSMSPAATSDIDQHSPGPLSPPPAPSYLSAGSSSRPGTPSLIPSGSARSGPSSSHSDDSVYTGHSMQANGLACAECQKPLTGQFVRALGTVFHLDCFRCQVSFQFRLYMAATRAHMLSGL